MRKELAHTSTGGIDANSALRALQALLFFSGICVWVISFAGETPNLRSAIVGILLVFASNIVYAMRNLRQRLLFLFMHLGIFLFLLSRPTFAFWYQDSIWNYSTYESNVFAYQAVMLSLVFLFAGALTYDLIHRSNYHAMTRQRRWRINNVERPKAARATLRDKLTGDEFLSYIRLATLTCFFVCLVGAYAEGAIKLSYMAGQQYEEYYLTSTSDYVPFAIGVLSTMCPFMYFGYLATMPKRLPATICMLLYVASTLPMLMIGSRSDFVIACLFCLLYYALRTITDRQSPWIGKREIIAIVIAIPLGVIAMGVLNYTRSDQVVSPQSIGALFVDAFYKQGVTFSVLSYGFEVNGDVQSLGFRFFSAGSIITNITQSFIGSVFLGLEQLGDANSALLALNGNSYAHTMSFFAHPNYLGGEGYGSSYILELYADFGYAGIALGSALIAFCFSALSCCIGKRWFWGTVALIATSYAFHVPRGSASEWISFIITVRFALAMALILAVAFALRLFLRSTHGDSIKSLAAKGQANVIPLGNPTIACADSPTRSQIRACAHERPNVVSLPKLTAVTKTGGIAHVHD